MYIIQYKHGSLLVGSILILFEQDFRPNLMNVNGFYLHLDCDVAESQIKLILLHTVIGKNVTKISCQG